MMNVAAGGEFKQESEHLGYLQCVYLNVQICKKKNPHQKTENFDCFVKSKFSEIVQSLIKYIFKIA